MNTYLIIIISILTISYLLDTVVNFLNVQHLKEQLPQEFEGWYDAERYRTSQRYLRERTRFGTISGTIMLLITLLMILLGGFNIIDHAARHFKLGPIPTGLIFSLILWAGSQIISIPFSIYSTFVLEEKYGFNKTTPRTFITDRLKGWALSMVIGTPILAGVLWFFGAAGGAAWLYCWVGITVIQLFLVFISPVLIMPLFNKFLPLEEGELKSAIETYAEKEHFKMKGVFKMDGSKRSTKTNAFFTGFGRFRRIALFDTLIEKHTVAELVGVIAHEMGHYKKKHILKMIITSIAQTGLMLFVLSLFIGNKSLHDAFSMDAVEPSIYASLFFFGFIYSPISMFLSVIGNIASRKHEYEADTYAAETTNDPESMISALKRLSSDNLSNLTPHPAIVFLEYGHPPVLQRISALRQQTKG
ncbi:MAG: M48 family metallopeptidase [Kiritimatiellae bacterium]|nr:M48 family metallopeptidase [Kiritimatiellia bacterium]